MASAVDEEFQDYKKLMRSVRGYKPAALGRIWRRPLPTNITPKQRSWGWWCALFHGNDCPCGFPDTYKGGLGLQPVPIFRCEGCKRIISSSSCSLCLTCEKSLSSQQLQGIRSHPYFPRGSTLIGPLPVPPSRSSPVLVVGNQNFLDQGSDETRTDGSGWSWGLKNLGQSRGYQGDTILLSTAKVAEDVVKTLGSLSPSIPQTKFFVSRVEVIGDDAEFVQELCMKDLSLDSFEENKQYFEDFLDGLNAYSQLTHMVDLTPKSGRSEFMRYVDFDTDLHESLCRWNDTKVIFLGRQALQELKRMTTYHPTIGEYVHGGRYYGRKVFCPSWLSTFSVNIIYCIAITNTTTSLILS